jgi:HK97 gp10 family phage protein
LAKNYKTLRFRKIPTAKRIERFHMQIDADSFRNLQKRLIDLDIAMKTEVYEELRKGAMRIVADAKRDAPWDTGKVRQQIAFQSEFSFADGQDRVEIFSNVEYSAAQEFGTKYQKGKPYFFHNVDKGVRKIIREIKKRLDAK